MGQRRCAKKKPKVQQSPQTSEFQTPMLTIRDEDAIEDFDLKQLHLTSVTYSCCFQHTDADRTPHILCHYLGVDVPTLREELRTFIGGNVAWIQEVCGQAFQDCHIKMDLYLNALIEPNFMFDDIALMIVAMMQKVHILVLCHNNYWTTRSNFEHKDCFIKLAFFRENTFKEISPASKGAPEFMGSGESHSATENATNLNQSVVSVTEDPCVSVEQNGSGHVNNMTDLNGTDDDLDMDLIGTGLLPQEEEVIQIDGNANIVVSDAKQSTDKIEDKPDEQNKTDVSNSEHAEQNAMDISEMENAGQNKLDSTDSDQIEQNKMDVSAAEKPNQNKTDVTDAENDEQNKTDVSDVEKPKQNKTDVSDAEEANQNKVDVSHEENDEKNQMDISETENPEQNEMEVYSGTENEEEDDTDSAEDSGIEDDGWQSESKACKATLLAKKQTKTFKTSDGSLFVRTVGYSKRVRRKKQHKCHLCGETFEMQCNFLKHYATKHPDNPFKCEHCSAVLQTPNGLFKHQRSHLYLKHECSECGKCFQFPMQRDTHMKIHTGQQLYPCLHCDRKFTLNSTMMMHAKTHNTQLICEFCPKNN